MAAPQKLIKLEGVVVDSKGGVLPGVTVVVKGTTIGVATDIDGKFSLEITETPGISLEFSFVGMNSKEIPVKIENGKVQPLRVVLEEAETELDEVVVTGMFSRKKEGFTGSAVTVKGDELKRSVLQVLLRLCLPLNPVSGSWKISVRVRIRTVYRTCVCVVLPRCLPEGPETIAWCLCRENTILIRISPY